MINMSAAPVANHLERKRLLRRLKLSHGKRFAQPVLSGRREERLAAKALVKAIKKAGKRDARREISTSFQFGIKSLFRIAITIKLL